MPLPALIKVADSKYEVLPLGRYLVTFDEIEDAYVTGLSAKRQEIWNAFRNCIGLIRSAVGSLAEVWIGGSFITSKEEPRDIDAVFLFTKDCFDAAASGSSNDAKLVLSILTRSSKINRLDPSVDGYALIVPPTEYDVSGEFETIYSRQRGYWDQFWSKTRFVDEKSDGWKYPASGYLEVIIDGYRNHIEGTND